MWKVKQCDGELAMKSLIFLLQCFIQIAVRLLKKKNVVEEWMDLIFGDLPKPQVF